MTNKSGNITREETLASVCTVILTALLCAYSLSLKQQELAEKHIVSLFEYPEPFTLPPGHPEAFQREIRKGNQRVLSSKGEAATHVARDSSSPGENRDMTESRLTSSSDSLSEMSSQRLDSASDERSPVFRGFKRSWELDSILKIPGDAGVALLREHLFHESQSYDTLLANHLIRSAKALAQVDVSQTLETQMKFNVGRYGLPYNPLRPQPPSAQIQIKGIVISVLGFLYSTAKEVPAAVARVIKPRAKQESDSSGIGVGLNK